MAYEINGTVRGNDNSLIAFEARQIDGDRWEIVIKQRGDRIENYTRAINPWPTIERLVNEQLDFAPKPEKPRYDLNKPIIRKVTAKGKRNIKPGDLPGDSKFDIAAIERALKEASNG